MNHPPLPRSLDVHRSHERLLNNLPGLVYRCRITHGESSKSSNFPNYYTYILEFVSKGSYELLGLTPDEMLGSSLNTIERMRPDDDSQKEHKAIHDSIVAHQGYQVMYRVVLPSGTMKWVWDQGEAVYDPDGTPLFLEGVMMDISAHKFRELEQQEKNETTVPACSEPSQDLTLEKATQELEARMIRKALEQCRWRRGEAAVVLGLNLRTLQRKMKRLEFSAAQE